MQQYPTKEAFESANDADIQLAERNATYDTKYAIDLTTRSGNRAFA